MRAIVQKSRMHVTPLGVTAARRLDVRLNGQVVSRKQLADLRRPWADSLEAMLHDEVREPETDDREELTQTMIEPANDPVADEQEDASDLHFDKLREECGVVAIHGHPDAARQAYLALYALQHRGQESAGIATADYTNLSNIKGMGLVADIFTEDVLAKLPGEMAIGHTRYSTTGDSALLNAQPIRVDSTKGLIAIAHNGNLVNLGNIRAKLEREGAFFQTTSDSEIIVQLIAHSAENTLVDAIADSLAANRRSLLHRHDDARPRLCCSRPTWFPPALHGTHHQCRRARHHRLRI